MPEISTAEIFQAAFIARQMEQMPQAFFQKAFEPIGRVCAARHARGGLGLQGKWRTRAYRTRPICGLRLAKNVFATDGLVKSTFLDNLSNRIRFSTQSTLAQFFTY